LEKEILKNKWIKFNKSSEKKKGTIFVFFAKNCKMKPKNKIPIGGKIVFLV